MVEHLSEEQGVVSSILTLGTNAPLVQWMRISCYEREDGGSIPSWGAKFMESNAGELVPRPALKTGFC